ncbi:hypothetical protein FHS10_004123 [Mucilaginibacter dorajii]|nr:hypothetical protein [Mucilaginibacter dorajii]
MGILFSFFTLTDIPISFRTSTTKWVLLLKVE